MKGIGQDFDDFMIEQGLYEEAQELATKRLIALQLEEEMKRQNISKSAMAKKCTLLALPLIMYLVLRTTLQ